MKEQTACLQMVKMNGSYSSVFTFTHPHLAYSNRFRPSMHMKTLQRRKDDSIPYGACVMLEEYNE